MIIKPVHRNFNNYYGKFVLNGLALTQRASLLFHNYNSSPSKTKELFDNVYIAGGFFRSFYTSTLPNDLDIFFKNSETYSTYRSIFDKIFFKVCETSRAITYQNASNFFKIQLIHYKYHDSIEDLLNSFDFNVAQCGMWQGKIYHIENYFEDLASKNLKYNTSDFPIVAIKRAIKFIKMGFICPDENYIKIGKEISEKVDFNSAVEIQKHSTPLSDSADGIYPLGEYE